MNNKYFNSKEITLENGLQLISIQKDTQISSIHLGIKVGSLYEKLDEKGMSHFIEHMLFKGTNKRDNDSINQDLEERAGSFNAYTEFNSTVLSITSLAEELEASLEILSDLTMNSVFPEDEIKKEKGVILAEIKSSNDDVEQYSFMKINELAFSKSPLKHDILGNEKNILNYRRDDLKGFYDKYYKANNAVISIVSPFSHEQIEEMVNRYFSTWETGNLPNINIEIENNKPLEKITYKKNIEQNTIIYLYTFHGLTRLEELALDIFNQKLGKSANSILFRELREKRGLAYDVFSQMDSTEFIKTLYIYTAVGEEDVQEAREVIDDCIQGIVNKEIIIDDNNISLMRKVIKTAIASILEDSEALGNYVVHQKVMNERIDAFVEDLDNLNKISADDIYNAADKVLRNPTVHILMNKE